MPSRLDRSALDGSAEPLSDVSRGADVDDVDGVRFSTIASFKGLEADVVLLIDVDDLSSNEGLASVYVGASRAKVALHVFVATSEKERFKDLAKEFGRAMAERST